MSATDRRVVYSSTTGDEPVRHPEMPNPAQVARLMGSNKGRTHFYVSCPDRNQVDLVVDLDSSTANVNCGYCLEVHTAMRREV